MPAPIELHYWPTPNGHKITIALEEMGLPYEVRLVNINKGEQFQPDFLRDRAQQPDARRSSTPRGRTAQPISIFESGAILQYLSRKTGMFGGRTERERIAVDQWLFWQMGGVGPDGGAGQPLPALRPADGPAPGPALCAGPLPARGRPPLRRARPPPRRQPLRRRPTR